MNSLAHVVHDLIVGREPAEAAWGSLTAQEQLTLEELRPELGHSPEKLARAVAKREMPNWPAPRTALSRLGS